jgi:hypothetical protein
VGEARRRVVPGDEEVGIGHGLVPQDGDAAFVLGDGEERLDECARIDPAVHQSSRHVRPRHLDPVDEARVPSVLGHDVADGHHDVVGESVGRDGQSLEIRRSLDPRVRKRDHSLRVPVEITRREVTGTDRHDRKPLAVRRDLRDEVREPEVVLPGDDRGDEGRATLGGAELELETPLVEQPELDAEVDRCDIGDR